MENNKGKVRRDPDLNREDAVSVEQLLRDVEREGNIPAMDSKELDRMINRRITAIVARVLLILGIVVALLLCMIHPVMKAVTYPYKEKAETVGSAPGELLTYLHTYTSIFMPYLEVYDVEVEERGFGQYTLQLYTTDHRERFVTPGYYGDLDTIRVFDERWDQSEDSDPRFVHRIGRFYLYKSLEEVIPELEELPKSAEIHCLLLLPEAVLPEQLWQDGISIVWMRADQAVNGLDAGIRIAQRVFITDEISHRESMTGEQLKGVFLKELELLLEDEKLLAILGVPYSIRDTKGEIEAHGGGCKSDSGGVTMVTELYEAAKEWDAFRTREVCVSGKKEEVLAYIEAVDAQGVYVEAVNMSQWSK